MGFWEMAPAIAVFARSLRILVVDNKFARAEEYDLGSALEPDFDQRIVARHGRHNCMDASGLADIFAMNLCEIGRLHAWRTNGYGAPNENAAARLCRVARGDFTFVGIHR
jgi:hypothetical protein